MESSLLEVSSLSHLKLTPVPSGKGKRERGYPIHLESSPRPTFRHVIPSLTSLYSISVLLSTTSSKLPGSSPLPSPFLLKQQNMYQICCSTFDVCGNGHGGMNEGRYLIWIHDGRAEEGEAVWVTEKGGWLISVIIAGRPRLWVWTSLYHEVHLVLVMERTSRVLKTGERGLSTEVCHLEGLWKRGPETFPPGGGGADDEKSIERGRWRNVKNEWGMCNHPEIIQYLIQTTAISWTWTTI